MMSKVFSNPMALRGAEGSIHTGSLLQLWVLAPSWEPQDPRNRSQTFLGIPSYPWII